MGYQRIIVPKSFGRSRKGAAGSLKGSNSVATGKVDSAVVECKTLFDALAAAFVNPDIAKGFSNRKSGNRNSRFRGQPTPAINSNNDYEAASHDAEDYANSNDEI